MSKEKIQRIELPAIEKEQIKLRVVGTAPLICHAWSDKAKQMMLDKQTKRASKGREAKNPEQCYRDSLYHMPDGDGYGFPAVAFKSAAVRAAKMAGVHMTDARCAFHVLGDLVRIDGEPRPREDMVRVGQGTADIRFRAEFPEWAVTLVIQYNPNYFSAEQIINLFNLAGFHCGVGEWRPSGKSSSHTFGMFEVANTEN